MISQHEYLKYIYVLLVSAYVLDQVNQFYQFDLFNFKKMVGYQGHNLFEMVTEFGLASFALYILFNFSIQSALVKFILILFSIFYSVDAIASTILFMDADEKKASVNALDNDIFLSEFLVTKVCTIALYIILYNTLF